VKENISELLQYLFTIAATNYISVAMNDIQ